MVAPALVIAAGLIALVALGLARILAPRREASGHHGQHDPRPVSPASTPPSRSVWLASLFAVVYAVQIVLLIPWAVSVRSVPLFALVEMAVLTAVVAVGVAYVRRERVSA